MGTISVAVPFADRWYFAGVLRGASERIRAAGHEPVVHEIPPSGTATAEAVAAVDRDFASPDALGAVVLGFKYRDDQRERILAWQRPLVVIGGSVLGFPTVMIDDAGAAWLATDHLMQLGHTRIAHLTGDLDDPMDFSVDRRRLRGHRLAMERAGLPLRVVETAFDHDAALAAATALLEPDDRPTAVFASSDELALPVLEAARRLGLEQEVSVVGFDDDPRAAPAGLTTIRQQPVEHGATAADLILSGVGHGPDPKRSRLMPTSLIVRSSTRRLR